MFEYKETFNHELQFVLYYKYNEMIKNTKLALC